MMHNFQSCRSFWYFRSHTRVNFESSNTLRSPSEPFDISYLFRCRHLAFPPSFHLAFTAMARVCDHSAKLEAPHVSPRFLTFLRHTTDSTECLEPYMHAIIWLSPWWLAREGSATHKHQWTYPAIGRWRR